MNIVIVDDHPLVRQGLTAIITVEVDMNLIGEGSNGDEALSLVTKMKPDVAIIDLRLKNISGLEIVRACKEKVSACKYIILTSSLDKEDFRRACELGVDGYLLKEAFPEELIYAIRLIQRGRKYYDPGMIDFMISREEKDIQIEQLTPRELDVLRALGEGLNNRDIGRKLFITEYTVKKHVSQVLAKLELADRTQAALYAHEKKVTT